MSHLPELQRLARRCSDDPQTALVQIMSLVCEQLDMSLAVLGSVRDGTHTVRLAVGAGVGRRREIEGALPARESWCGHVPGRSPLIVRDVADEPELQALEATRLLDVQCYAGTVVRDTSGADLGVLGVLRHSTHDRLDARDVVVLEELAEVVGPLYEALLARDHGAAPADAPAAPAPAPVEAAGPALPAQRAAAQMASVADAVSQADSVEGLTRPLLDALHELSGIATSYLTVLHEDAGVQEVRFARNAREDFGAPEGLEMPWEATLCKQALDEGRPCTTDVPGVWPENQVGIDFGLVTFVSVPVRLSDGRVWGTLCAVDQVAHEGAADHVSTLSLFARLISAEVERASVVAQERARASRARYEADTDELTGCSSRRTVQPWLEAALAACEQDEVVLLTFLDVDRFKDVNDRLGHATGDTLLATLGVRLLGSARPGDLVARLGGDEFVVGARLPRHAATSLEARVRAAGSFLLPTADGPLPVRCSTGIASSDDAADPTGLLSLSDARMYDDKALVRPL